VRSVAFISIIAVLGVAPLALSTSSVADDKAAEINKAAQALNTLLSNYNGPNSDIASGLKTLRSALDAQGQKSDPRNFIIERIKDLSTQLSDPKTLTIIKSSDDADAALKALQPIIETATSQTSRTVFIVAATFGDSRNIGGIGPRTGKNRRWCNATDAMRSNCLDSPACGLPTNLSNLCGYDPVPNINPQFRLLAVDFLCVTASERQKYFDLQVVPSGKTRAAELRSSDSKLLCGLPPTQQPQPKKDVAANQPAATQPPASSQGPAANPAGGASHAE